MSVRSKEASLPPAIIMDGGANALSVARGLGRMGVTVYALNEVGAFSCCAIWRSDFDWMHIDARNAVSAQRRAH